MQGGWRCLSITVVVNTTYSLLPECPLHSEEGEHHLNNSSLLDTLPLELINKVCHLVGLPRDHPVSLIGSGRWRAGGGSERAQESGCPYIGVCTRVCLSLCVFVHVDEHLCVSVSVPLCERVFLRVSTEVCFCMYEFACVSLSVSVHV